MGILSVTIFLGSNPKSYALTDTIPQGPHMDNKTTLKKRLKGINQKSYYCGRGELSQRDHFPTPDYYCVTKINPIVNCFSRSISINRRMKLTYQ